MGRWVLLTGPVLALAVNCATYLVARHALGSGLAGSILAGLAVGLAAIVAGTIAALEFAGVDPWELSISYVGTYLALSFCFWTFLNLNVTSLRIRVLRELWKAGGTAPLSKLLVAYSEEERLNRRLDRLVSGGQISLVNGRWKLKSRVLLVMARCFDALRWIMGLRDGRHD